MSPDFDWLLGFWEVYWFTFFGYSVMLMSGLSCLSFCSLGRGKEVLEVEYSSMFMLMK